MWITEQTRTFRITAGLKEDPRQPPTPAQRQRRVLLGETLPVPSQNTHIHTHTHTHTYTNIHLTRKMITLVPIFMCAIIYFKFFLYPKQAVYPTSSQLQRLWVTFIRQTLTTLASQLVRVSSSACLSGHSSSWSSLTTGHTPSVTPALFMVVVSYIKTQSDLHWCHASVTQKSL